MPYRVCPECKGAVQGMLGHRSLVLVAYPEEGKDHEGVIFRCSVCGTLWRRAYIGAGMYAWYPNMTDSAPDH